MSTIKVNKIENTSTTDGGVEIDSSGHVQVDGLQMPTAGALSNRNRWINGAMAVDQRRSGSSQTSANNNDYVVDRLRFEGVNGKCTIGQNLNSITPPVGFKTYAGLEVTTAHTLGAGEHFNIGRWLEGYSVSDFELGTANAKKFTVSFWVRSSVTGTYGLSLLGFNGATFRHYVKEYTIDSANTWEYKTLTVQGDTSTTITWNTTNGTGLFIEWNLGAGTNNQTAADTWSTGLFRSSPNQTNLFATNGATFYLTGVQLEVGEKATPFEHRSFDTELDLCRRYFQTSYGYGVGIGASTYSGGSIYRGNSATTVTPYVPFRFMKEMRAIPTVTGYSPGTGAVNKCGAGTGGGGADQDWDVGISSIGRQSFMYFNNGNVVNGTRVYPTTSYYHLYAHYTAEAEI